MKKFLPLTICIGLFSISLFFIACEDQNCKNDFEAKVYVANEESGTISVIDLETYEEYKTIDLMEGSTMYMPHNVQVAPDGQSVWATAIPMDDEEAEDKVFVINPKKDKEMECISLGTDLHLAHVVLDDESKYAYVTANEGNVIIKINADTYKEEDRFSLPDSCGPHGLRYADEKLYIAAMTLNALVIMDVTDGSYETVALGGIAVQTACKSSLDDVYITLYDTRTVIHYTISTQDTVQIALPAESQGPIQSYLSPDNKKLYVCDQGNLLGMPASNKLYVIDTEIDSVINSVDVGMGAHGVVVNPDGTQIYVSNTVDNTVSVIDAATLDVISTITIGTAPNGISYLSCY